MTVYFLAMNSKRCINLFAGGYILSLYAILRDIFIEERTTT